jgi:hypothetical protein
MPKLAATRIITSIAGLALLLTVACAPLPAVTDEETRQDWRYGYYVQQLLNGGEEGLKATISASANGGVETSAAAEVALDDYYRSSK